MPKRATPTKFPPTFSASAELGWAFLKNACVLISYPPDLLTS